MNAFTKQLLVFCRGFGLLEREAVCCGTVTVQQCVVLQSLLGEPADISTLATISGVNNSTMTRLVDGLERRSWVERQRDVHDRRRVLVALTPAGRVEAERLSSLTERTVTAVLARIPEAKHAQILEVLELLSTALAEARKEDLTCC